MMILSCKFCATLPLHSDAKLNHIIGKVYHLTVDYPAKKYLFKFAAIKCASLNHIMVPRKLVDSSTCAPYNDGCKFAYHYGSKY